MAGEREAQGTFPSFIISQNIAIFSSDAISIQICTFYFSLSCSSLPGRPTPMKHLAKRARGVENHRMSVEKQLFLFNINMLLKPG